LKEKGGTPRGENAKKAGYDSGKPIDAQEVEIHYWDGEIVIIDE